MTQIANITVKNGSVVDQVFTAFQPQSGSDPAVWLAKDANPREKWASLTASVRRTTNKASRLKLNITLPLFDLTGARIGSIPSSVEVTIPDSATDAQIKDAQAYLTNILANALVKDMILTGSPAI